MASPSIRHRVLFCPRRAASADEYEDAGAVQASQWPVSAAVADGATESAFSGVWARTLVRGLVEMEGRSEKMFTAAVPEWRDEWRSVVRSETAESPWYVRKKVSEGAFAAVLGLFLSDGGDWRALSVGDCCLFHLRAGRLLRTWPYERPDAFTHRPRLLVSQPNRSIPTPKTVSGTWAAGDTFLLASDAVSEWLLREGVSLTIMRDNDTFRTVVTEARTSGVLREDDATLLVIEVEGEATHAAEGSESNT